MKKIGSKKSQNECSESMSAEDMHKFWGVEQMKKFNSLKNCPIVPIRVINLAKLDEIPCTVSTYFKAQKLPLLLRLCGIEYYKEPIRLFYSNLRVLKDNGELETLVLKNRIFVNDFLFQQILWCCSLYECRLAGRL